ncbi:non-specific serine/threonine protein kinase [Trifolium repens]|nr:non-specific serine/threonine protein kinase [Trifolium repens]
MNGAIILTDQQGHETLIVNANARASSASMLDSGNFKIHLYGANDNSNFTHHMANSTGRFCLHKTNTTSSYNDKYYLKLNSKGSLQIWNSRNDSSPIATLPGAENDQQKTGGNQIIYHATLDFDGGFRLRAHHVNNGNSNEKTLSCKRNYSKADCRGGKDGVSFYDMVPMNNILWREHPYFETEDMLSEQNCSFACLVDCNCWAALYDGSRCKKQGFPLRYVRRAHESKASSTAFIKCSFVFSNYNIYSLHLQDSGTEIQNEHWEHGAE